jgi:hypothetical protein
MTGMRISFLWAGPGRSTRPAALAATLAFVAGSALVLWSAAVHLDLWDSGYRSIATIGPLFLLQSIGGIVLGLLILAVRRVWAALLGIGFALSTLAGFLVSVAHGLFGFRDSWDAPFAQEAFVLEIAIVVVLLFAGALCLAQSAPASTPRATPERIAS